jgi:CBS domain-containing protein
MSRDEYLNAMLRELGAAYYQTLHGEGAASDVARAVDAITEAQADLSLAAGPGRSSAGGEADSRLPGWRRRRWRIRDVMTTDTAAADRSMTYKQVVRLMTDRRVNAVPVVDSGYRVLGMVSEADVLRKQERGPRRSGARLGRRGRRERNRADARTVGELMTSPAITIHPDAPLSAAARLMNARHIRRLPVVDGSGELIGVVSRRDLMKVFLRPDTEIEAEVRDVLTDILLEGSVGITVAVHEGVVTLTGVLTDKDMIPVATRLASDVPGVVAVANHLGGEARAEPDNPG